MLLNLFIQICEIKHIMSSANNTTKVPHVPERKSTTNPIDFIAVTRGKSTRNKSSKLNEAVKSLAPKSRNSKQNQPHTSTTKSKRKVKTSGKGKPSIKKKSKGDGIDSIGDFTCTTATTQSSISVEKVSKAPYTTNVPLDKPTTEDSAPSIPTDLAATRSHSDKSSNISNIVESVIANVLPNAIKAAHISLLQPVKKGNYRDVKNTVWPSNIYNYPYANPSADGTFIECLACKGKGRVNGIITMRHPFQTVNWDGSYGHVNTKGHKISVNNIEAEEEKGMGSNNKLALIPKKM